MEEYRFQRKETEKYFTVDPFTIDHTRIDITMNIGSDQDQDLESAEYTDGVGLFRTEFLYMKRCTMPTEEEQFTSYKRVLQIYGDKPVIIRTLDIGGDKKLECMELPKEENPFPGT